MASKQSIVHQLVPGEEPEGQEFVDFYVNASMVLAPLAFVVSYARNRDVMWAAVHALLIGPPYLAWVAYDATRDVTPKGG